MRALLLTTTFLAVAAVGVRFYECKTGEPLDWADVPGGDL